MGARPEPFHGGPARRHEEFLIVPLHVARHAIGVRVLHARCVKRVAVGFVHVGLRGEREGDIVGGPAEVLDFLRSIGFLFVELAAWQGHGKVMK